MSKNSQLAELNDENNFDWKANFSDNVYKICYICKTSFAGLHLLTKHLRTHLDVQCIECSRNFPTALGLVRLFFEFRIVRHILEFSNFQHEHLRVRFKCLALENNGDAGQPEVKMYNCREQGCTYQASTIKMYTEHVFKCHGIKKAFFCDECGKSYKFKSNLEEHLLKHKSVFFPCDKCDKKFSSKSGLYVHRREQHSSSLVRPSVKCDICSFVSKGMRNLKKHKETHNKAAYSRYSCSYCHKTFRNRNSLNVHTLIHTGEQPYRCNVCLKSFKRSHHLYSHLNCVDHKNKLEAQKKMGAENLPDPIYSVTKPSFQTSSDNPIYMEVTDANGSNATTTVQVVSQIEPHHSSITADQFAVFLASTDEYKEYIMENEDE